MTMKELLISGIFIAAAQKTPYLQLQVPSYKQPSPLSALAGNQLYHDAPDLALLSGDLASPRSVVPCSEAGFRAAG